MELEYKSPLYKQLIIVLMIFLILIGLLTDPFTRDQIRRASTLKELSAYSFVLVCCLFMFYRTMFMIFKFKKIQILEEKLIIPQFGFYFKEKVISFAEIAEWYESNNEIIGGIVVKYGNSKQLTVYKKYLTSQNYKTLKDYLYKKLTRHKK